MLLVLCGCKSEGGSATVADAGSPVDAPVGADAPADAGAGDAALAPGETTETLSSGGMSRSYIVHVPPGYTGKTAVPVVLDFHPLLLPASSWKTATSWGKTADEQGFIVVWPQGYMNSWNVGRCCNPAFGASVDDVAFVRAILGKLEAEGNIDPKRVYATGCSNGGGMAYKLACSAADVVAAVAPVDFDCITGSTNSPSCGNCAPSRAISECQFRGTADMFVPYDGGPTSVVAGLLFPGAQANFATWASKNACTGSPAPEAAQPACETYPTCAAGVETTLCTVDGGTHCGDYGTFPIVDIAWAMFQKESLP
jgi:polyhydroxybutyrate depolymerase